ncbi:hypothetical protein GGE65_000762 [Skermanella aerolata]
MNGKWILIKLLVKLSHLANNKKRFKFRTCAVNTIKVSHLNVYIRQKSGSII